MARIKDVLIYLLKNYPHPEDLSNARITKLVFLCDWKHSLDVKKQLTSIQWYFDNYGPFVWDVINCAEENSKTFEIVYTTNYFGGHKKQLTLKDDSAEVSIKRAERRTIDHIIQITHRKSWDEFIQLVYSTYPIVNSERYRSLNLVEMAKDYRKSKTYKNFQHVNSLT